MTVGDRAKSDLTSGDRLASAGVPRLLADSIGAELDTIRAETATALKALVALAGVASTGDRGRLAWPVSETAAKETIQMVAKGTEAALERLRELVSADQAAADAEAAATLEAHPTRLQDLMFVLEAHAAEEFENTQRAMADLQDLEKQDGRPEDIARLGRSWRFHEGVEYGLRSARIYGASALTDGARLAEEVRRIKRAQTRRSEHPMAPELKLLLNPGDEHNKPKDQDQNKADVDVAQQDPPTDGGEG